MAPRNKDANANASCHKQCSTSVEDDNELDMATFVPSLLHKKHKVVKLVKSQLKKIHEEGLLDGQGFDCQYSLRGSRMLRGIKPGSSKDQTEAIIDATENDSKGLWVLCYFVGIILALLFIILLAVWISAGPLSNPMAYTPIPTGSFVRTDGLCSLEKKYLLRWGKPEY